MTHTHYNMRNIDIPDEYLKLFDALMKVRKYTDQKADVYLKEDLTVNNKTRLMIAIAGDEDAESAAKFIDEFEQKRRCEED